MKDNKETKKSRIIAMLNYICLGDSNEDLVKFNLKISVYLFFGSNICLFSSMRSQT